MLFHRGDTFSTPCACPPYNEADAQPQISYGADGRVVWVGGGGWVGG